MTPSMVDAHVHVFRPAGVSPRGCDELAPAERDAPVEDLKQVLGGAGVRHAVLVPLDGADDYVAEVLAANPGTFAAIAVATEAEQGRSTVDPVRAVRERRARFPFAGLRTMWLGDPSAGMADSPMLPVLRHLADEGIVLWSYLPPRQFPLLAQALRLVPGLQVLLNHLGFTPHDMWVDEHRRPRFDGALGPELIGRIAALAEFDDVHLMVSGQYAMSTQDPPYADLFAPTRTLAAAFGPARLLWASDYPWPRDVPGYSVLPGLVREALPRLTEDELADVLGGNAHRLFAGQFTPPGIAAAGKEC